MSVKYTDSMSKVKYYLNNLSPDKTVILSDLFLRDYTCPSGCGGCCLKFSLDFVEGTDRWELFKELYPDQVQRFKERNVDGMKVFTDWQEDNDTRWCRNLRLSDGRCNIHKSNPFTCEFELIKVINNKKTNKTHIMKKLFGRGWQYKRVDGGVGAKCEMISFNPNKLNRDIELLKELEQYSFMMNMKTKLNIIINKLININKLWT